METSLKEALAKGVELYKAGQLDLAKELYASVIQLEGRHADANHNTGVIELDMGNVSKSLTHLKIALEQDSGNAQYWISYIDALILQGSIDEARNMLALARKKGAEGDAFDQLEQKLLIENIQNLPNIKNLEPSEDQLYLLAELYNERKFEKAFDEVLKLLIEFPHSAALRNYHGAINKGLGRLIEAIESFKKAIELQPDYAEAYNNLGKALHSTGKLDAAILNYKKAICIRPIYAEAHNGMGSVLLDKGNIDAAIDSCKCAIEIKPDYAGAFSNMGAAFQAKGNVEEAIYSYKKALKINPNFVEAYNNISIALICKADYSNALKNLEVSLQINSDQIDATLLKSRLLLHSHEFKSGWKLYDQGIGIEMEGRAERWNGSCLHGKNIQVFATQGVGDEILFSSCIPDLIQQSPNKIYLECDPRLQPLFARSFPGVNVYVNDRRDKSSQTCKKELSDKVKKVDYSIPIHALPQFFRNRIEDFPERDSFLIPDIKLVKKWSKRLHSLGEGFKIGISWRGGTDKIGENAKNRSSIPLSLWNAVLSEDAFFINLQYGDVSDEISEFSLTNNIKIYDWEDNNPLLDLDNQAALISELDLVISVDNATIHSCVALGTQVWDVMDPSLNLMWLRNDRDFSPLSPHLRFFRKETHGKWSAVLKQIEMELHEWMNRR